MSTPHCALIFPLPFRASGPWKRPVGNGTTPPVVHVASEASEREARLLASRGDPVLDVGDALVEKVMGAPPVYRSLPAS